MRQETSLADFLRKEFPQTQCIIEDLGKESSIIRHPVSFNELRPGGTVSGPVMMELADVAIYVAILNEIGLKPDVFTTSFSINFLRKPPPKCDIIAKCSLIKLGRTLAVGEVSLYSEGEENPVAHAVATYSLKKVLK
jgi:acyl-coenzyme A thioesterase PaaI-like protein